MRDIAKAAPNAQLIFTRGNHEERWDNWLSNKVPEFDGVAPHFADHFPDWRHCISLQINDDTVVKHRWHSGVGAARNNTLKSGQNIITGHSHRLGVVSLTDGNGTRYGKPASYRSQQRPEPQKPREVSNRGMRYRMVY
jgi:hypothetical protein